MSVTLLQGLILALIVFAFAWDARWECFFVFHPIIVCFVTGLVLGDWKLGLEAGAIAELSYLGLTTVGGTVPLKFYVFLPEIILTSLYAVVAFLSTYALQNVLSKFVNSFPEFVSHGFEIAGGLLPGLGLALLLKVMVKKENVPYLIIGFLIMSIMKPDNVLPVALFAIALVLIDFMRDKEAKTTSVVTGGEDDGEGI